MIKPPFFTGDTLGFQTWENAYSHRANRLQQTPGITSRTPMAPEAENGSHKSRKSEIDSFLEPFIHCTFLLVPFSWFHRVSGWKRDFFFVWSPEEGEKYKAANIFQHPIQARCQSVRFPGHMRCWNLKVNIDSGLHFRLNRVDLHQRSRRHKGSR